MKVIFVNVSEIESLSKYGTIHSVEIIKGYDKKKYLGVDIDQEYEINPVIELEDDVQIIKWFETDHLVYLTDEKLELFRNKIMKMCELTEIFSLEKMKGLLDRFIQRQTVSNVYSLIEFAFEYPGVLLPETNYSKEPIPILYMMFEPYELVDYKDDIHKHGQQISIKQHSLMMELPMHILTTYYGLLTKISQVYRSLFPNTWSQAYLNFTSSIVIRPMGETMIVITNFSYYHGYNNHPNTHTMLDNIRTVQLLKDHSTTLSLVKDYTLTVPFPTIYGVSTEFNVMDENMNVNVSCYHPDFTFGDTSLLEEVLKKDWKIPGDTTFGYLDDKNAFDPHQYHYILRRLTRSLYDEGYYPYYCIMSEDDVPSEVMYFHV